VRAATDIEDSCADIVGACLHIPNGLVLCASPQHFSVLFRRRIGVPPSAWRALHRAR
jgi:hypothetical protein